jgi:hypothetical protein
MHCWTIEFSTMVLHRPVRRLPLQVRAVLAQREHTEAHMAARELLALAFTLTHSHSSLQVSASYARTCSQVPGACASCA